MLTATIIFALLFSLASAAVIGQPQQVLASDTANLTDVLTVTEFSIEDMSDANFHVHHTAAKALLGEASYIALRQAEIEQRRQEIWQFLWNHDLECADWVFDVDEQPLFDHRPKLWFSGDRVFDVDPARVPADVITALRQLSEQEWKIARDVRYRRIFNATDAEEMGVSRNPFAMLEDVLPVTIPDEYMQYLIPESVIEEEDKISDQMWKEKEDEDKKKILAGKRSVRDVKMPDLSECTKGEHRIVREF